MKERQGWKEEQGPWGVRDTTKESWWPLEWGRNDKGTATSMWVTMGCQWRWLSWIFSRFLWRLFLWGFWVVFDL